VATADCSTPSVAMTTLNMQSTSSVQAPECGKCYHFVTTKTARSAAVFYSSAAVSRFSIKEIYDEKIRFQGVPSLSP
jgi:hypothetical protein